MLDPSYSSLQATQIPSHASILHKMHFVADLDKTGHKFSDQIQLDDPQKQETYPSSHSSITEGHLRVKEVFDHNNAFSSSEVHSKIHGFTQIPSRDARLLPNQERSTPNEYTFPHTQSDAQHETFSHLYQPQDSYHFPNNAYHTNNTPHFPAGEERMPKIARRNSFPPGTGMKHPIAQNNFSDALPNSFPNFPASYPQPYLHQRIQAQMSELQWMNRFSSSRPVANWFNPHPLPFSVEHTPEYYWTNQMQSQFAHFRPSLWPNQGQKKSIHTSFSPQDMVNRSAIYTTARSQFDVERYASEPTSVPQIECESKIVHGDCFKAGGKRYRS